eukprot:scaffold118082_cov34-Tisochrysis_lutea.AAC.2
MAPAHVALAVAMAAPTSPKRGTRKMSPAKLMIIAARTAKRGVRESPRPNAIPAPTSVAVAAGAANARMRK